MARAAFTVDVRQSIGNGRYVVVAGRGAPVSVDVADAVAALDTLTTAITTEQAAATALEAAKVASAAVTAVQDAMDVLQADAGSPTEAHVDDADTAWDTVSAAITALNTAVDDLVTASDALDAAPVEAELTAATLPATADVILDINTSNVTTKNQLKAAVDAAMTQVAANGILTD